ncbi:Leucine-zipper-like transcriptional regulator 1 [Nowakowskiella sp. JEL0407]|nr:Leucine-zipper-like transcriptional regulator 1 [Nowakowskiella sp. JEL0407]
MDLSPKDLNVVKAYLPKFPLNNQPPKRAPGKWTGYHSVLTRNSTVVVIDLSPANEVSVFDLSAGGKWTNYNASSFSGPVPSNRYGFASAVLPNGKIFLHGGNTNYNDTNTTALNDCYLLDIEKRSWEKMANGPFRALHTISVIRNDVVSYGGFVRGMSVLPSTSELVALLDVYDYTQNKWIAPANLVEGNNIPPSIAAATSVVYKNKMYLFSGYIGGDGVSPLSWVLSYSESNSNWEWTSKSFPIKPRSLYAAGISSNGYMATWTGYHQPPYYESLNLWNVEADSWSIDSAIPDPDTAQFNNSSGQIKSPISSHPVGSDNKSPTVIGVIVTLVVALIVVTVFAVIYYRNRSEHSKLFKKSGNTSKNADPPTHPPMIVNNAATRDSTHPQYNLPISNPSSVVPRSQITLQGLPEPQPIQTPMLVPLTTASEQNPISEPMPYEIALQMSALENERLRLELELAQMRTKILPQLNSKLDYVQDVKANIEEPESMSKSRDSPEEKKLKS